MSKITGFDFDYDCISDGEAFQRNHEYGENFIDLKELKEVKDFKRIIGNYAKVFRSDVVKRIAIEKVTVGDFVIVEKGDIIPADATVIEAKQLVVTSLLDNKLIDDDLTNKEVFQGMKVVAGKATLMINKIGKDTVLSGKLLELLEKNNGKYFRKNILGYLLKYLIACGIVAIITLIICLIRFWGTEDFVKSFIYVGNLIMALLPLEFGLILLINTVEIRKRLKSNGIKIKNSLDLVDVDNIRVICVDDKFVSSITVNDMQRLYRAGIRVIMLSSKNKDESKKLAIDSGLSANDDTKIVTGNEVKSMEFEELVNVALDVMVFAEMDVDANNLIVKSLGNIGISVISVGNSFGNIIALKFASLGILIGGKKKNLESKVARIFTQAFDIKVLIELLVAARKFNDSIKKSLKYIIATRVPLILITIMLIILNKNISINPIYVAIVYFVINTIFANWLGTISGDELLVNIEEKKKMFTTKDIGLLILKTVSFVAILACVCFIELHFNLSEEIISYSLIGAILFGCILIAFLDRDKTKAKVIKPNKLKKEKPVKEKLPKVKTPKVAKIKKEERQEEKKSNKEIKEKDLKKVNDEEKHQTTSSVNLPPEKPWMSEEDKAKEINNSVNIKKMGYKNKKQQRTEELKGKML